MRSYNKEQIDIIIPKIKQGAVFVYPTDTIYGIGCDATNSESVKRIRDLKKQYENPFSIIPPSLEWVREHCVVSDIAAPYLEKLPGPYTFILNLKDTPVSEILLAGKKSVGIRMPDIWTTSLAAESGRPIVTTSVNVHGEPFLTSIADLPSSFQVDFVIDEGDIKGQPSSIIDLTGEEPKQIR